MITLIITDFDGTLADTFRPNHLAYRDALAPIGIDLTEADYRQYFGLRFDDFMTRIGIQDTQLRQQIREAKTAAHFKISPDAAPKTVIVFEDSPAGLQAAQSANLPVLPITLPSA